MKLYIFFTDPRAQGGQIWQVLIRHYSERYILGATGIHHKGALTGHRQFQVRVHDTEVDKRTAEAARPLINSK